MGEKKANKSAEKNVILSSGFSNGYSSVAFLKFPSWAFILC